MNLRNLVILLFSCYFLSACVVSDSSSNKIASINACLSAEAIQKDTARITFSVPEKALAFRITRDGTTIYEDKDPDTTQIIETNLTPDQTYRFYCEMVADYDIGYERVGRLVLTMPAGQPPQFDGIKTLTQVNTTTVQVGWNLSEDEIIHHYKIFKYIGVATDKSDFPNEAEATLEDLAQVSHVIGDLGDEITYSFRVTACNSADDCDDNNVILHTTMPNTGAPRTSGATAINFINGDIVLTAPWNDNLGYVKRRSIYRASTSMGQTCPSSFGLFTKVNDVLVTEPRLTPTSLTASGTLNQGTKYCYIVRDTDPSGNTETNSNILSYEVGDLTRPNFTSTVNLERDTNNPETALVASWTAMINENTDALAGAAIYQVYLSSVADGSLPDLDPCTNGSLLQTVDANAYASGSTVSVTLSGLSPRNWHRVCIKAVDTAQLESDNQPKALASTGDTTAPDFAGIQSVAINNVTASVEFTFIASPSADVKNYRITTIRTRNGVVNTPVILDKVYTGLVANQNTTKAFSLSEAGLEGNDSVQIRVDVCDNASPIFNSQDNCTATAAVQTMLIPDIIPPQNFLGILRADPGSSHRSISVTWPAPSSWTDYAGFKVYVVENGSLVPLNSNDCLCTSSDCVAHPKTTCEVDKFDSGSFLVPSKDYEVYVAAFDSAGNSSVQYIDHTGVTKVVDRSRAQDLVSPIFNASISLSYVAGVKAIFNAATDDQDSNLEITYEFYRVIDTSFVCPLTPYESNNGCDGLTPIATLPQSALTVENGKLTITDTTVVDGHTYEYQACALDLAQNRTCQTGSVGSISVDDVTPPTITDAKSLKLVGGGTSWDVTFRIADNITAANQLKIEVFKDAADYPDQNNPGSPEFESLAGTVTVDAAGNASFTDTGTADVISMHYLIKVRDLNGNSSYHQLRDMLPAPVITSVEWPDPVDANGNPVSHGNSYTNYPYPSFLDRGIKVTGTHLNNIVSVNDPALSPHNRVCQTSRMSDRTDTEFKCSLDSRVYLDQSYNLIIKDVHNREITVSTGTPVSYCDYADANNITELRGLGTSFNPYTICRPEHFNVIGRNADNPNNNKDIIGEFVLGRDIDFTGVTDFKGLPVMDIADFKLDGYQNYSRSIKNLTIDTSATNEDAAFIKGCSGSGLQPKNFLANTIFDNVTVKTGTGRAAVVLLDKTCTFNITGVSEFIRNVRIINSTIEANNTAGFMSAEWALSRESIPHNVVQDSILKSSRTDSSSAVGGFFGKVTGTPLGQEVELSNLTVNGVQLLPEEGQDSAGRQIGFFAGYANISNVKIYGISLGNTGSLELVGAVDKAGGFIGHLDIPSSSNLRLGGSASGSSLLVKDLSILSQHGNTVGNIGGLIGLVDVNSSATLEIDKVSINSINMNISSSASNLSPGVAQINGGVVSVKDMSVLSSIVNAPLSRGYFGGIFGSAFNGTSLNLESVFVNDLTFSGGRAFAGGILGYIQGINSPVSIRESRVYLSNLSLTSVHHSSLGGFVGKAFEQSLSIQESVVSRSSLSSPAPVGGLVGLFHSGDHLVLQDNYLFDRYGYSNAAVQGSGDNVGGLLGLLTYNNADGGGAGKSVTMERNGVFVSVTSSSSTPSKGTVVGGFAIGITQQPTKVINNNYYQNGFTLGGIVNTDSLDAANQVEGISNTQLKTQATFIGWDFTNIWEMTAFGSPTSSFPDHPRLRSAPFNSNY